MEAQSDMGSLVRQGVEERKKAIREMKQETKERLLQSREKSGGEQKGKHFNWMNLSTIIGMALIVLFCIYGYRLGIFSSLEALQNYMAGFGIWAPLIFVIIQAVQVVIPILPGAIGCAAGVLVFGPIEGFAYNYIGICAGSIAAFLLSRRYGRDFVKRMVSEKAYEKYAGWLEQKDRFDKMFAIAIFLPVAPDDLLCYLAGLTRMKVRKFVWIILLGKPAALLLYSMGMSEGLKLFLK